MEYTVITENDTSEWKDKTGELYHFPKRYLKYLKKDTQVVYYKGRIKDPKFSNNRLSPEPHYFGIAKVGKLFLDTSSRKQDYFVEIINFVPFSKSVPLKLKGGYIETIPSSRENNYWRDGVRPIDEETFHKILKLSDFSRITESEFNNNNQDIELEQEPSFIEGEKKYHDSSYYEQNPKLRHQAITIHGYTCMGCGFNFEKAYGEKGRGYIHVHQIKPISEVEETKVNPKTDMIVLCANCHSIVHRNKNSTLTLQELKDIVNIAIWWY